MFTAPSTAIEPEAAEQLVDLSPFEHLVLPVTKHLTLGESDEDASVDGQSNGNLQSRADGVTAEETRQHSIFEREAFDQWLEDQGDRRLQHEARPKTSVAFQLPDAVGDQPGRLSDKCKNGDETEADFSTIIAPNQYQPPALEEKSERKSGEGYQLNPDENFNVEFPFTEDFDPVENFEQETIDPASLQILETEAEQISAQDADNSRSPSKPPRFAQDQPFRPQFKQRKKFAALTLLVDQQSEIPSEEAHPDANLERPSDTSQQFQQARQIAHPIRPSFKPLRSFRLLERLEEAIQKEEVEENIESFDVEEKENQPPEPEGDEQEPKYAGSPKREPCAGGFEEEEDVDLSTPRSKKRDLKRGGSKKKVISTRSFLTGRFHVFAACSSIGQTISNVVVDL